MRDTDWPRVEKPALAVRVRQRARFPASGCIDLYSTADRARPTRQAIVSIASSSELISGTAAYCNRLYCAAPCCSRLSSLAGSGGSLTDIAHARELLAQGGMSSGFRRRPFDSLYVHPGRAAGAAVRIYHAAGSRARSRCRFGTLIALRRTNRTRGVVQADLVGESPRYYWLMPRRASRIAPAATSRSASRPCRHAGRGASRDGRGCRSHCAPSRAALEEKPDRVRGYGAYGIRIRHVLAILAPLLCVVGCLPSACARRR